ncbi:glycine zipper 2TM domain-containing protein [Erythrobacter sp. JK5]|uniref:glycine zipper 2TM domain-containing protein n=1 Tax=Erythrobacter sp. JK5 TaxID=2829500 RepID=UPI001BAB5DE7|nr:glycine zipper 2TM domain-containing protein [Erythrobacter sp. JK5]QUL38439.1 glycine zipper 2TM domain-containing protein [Erythrobacter sp. JK5]
MKKIAIIAAAGSLATFAAPAQAAELPAIGNSAFLDASSISAPHSDPFRLGDYDDWDDYDDDYRDRRYRRGRGHDRAYDRYDRYNEPRRIRRGDRVWRGRDGRYYCKRDNGTTGLIIGAAGGALIGRAIDTRGDRTVGTLLGGALGAVLGREIDRGSARCR